MLRDTAQRGSRPHHTLNRVVWNLLIESKKKKKGILRVVVGRKNPHRM